MFLPETLHRILYLDPDILNAMYGFRTLEIEDAVWNYDARNYNTCLLKSGGAVRYGLGDGKYGYSSFLREIKAMAERIYSQIWYTL